MPIEEIRKQVHFPKGELETPFGKMYYYFSSGMRAHFGTDRANPSTINGVPYQIDIELYRYPDGEDQTPPLWKLTHHRDIIRRTDGYTHGWGHRRYTDAAYKTVTDMLVPMLSKFMVSQPMIEAGKDARKIEINNEIVKLQESEDGIIQSLRQNRDEQQQLFNEESELGGPYVRRGEVEEGHPEHDGGDEAAAVRGAVAER